MHEMPASECSECPSTADCGASQFRPVAAAFRELRDYIRTVGPGHQAVCLADETPSDRELRKVAGKIAAARKRRARTLPAELLGEPAWDILLELYALGSAQSMKSISIGAAVPLTTTLRWVALLEQRGMLHQFADPRDGRRTMVGLTPQGQAKVAEAVNDIRAATIGGAD